MELGVHLHLWQWATGTEYQVEGAHGAAKLVSLNHLVPIMQQRPWGLLVLWCGLPGVTAAAAGTGEPNLWVLGFACHARAPGGQYGSTADMGEPSLRVVGALGSVCWHGL
jgi:hypothetical protein